MSWHCLFCGCSEHWMRGKEVPEKAGMVEIIFKDESGKKLVEYVAHANCTRRVLKRGQRQFMINGDLSEFHLIKDAENQMEEE